MTHVSVLTHDLDNAVVMRALQRLHILVPRFEWIERKLPSVKRQGAVWLDLNETQATIVDPLLAELGRPSYPSLVLTTTFLGVETRIKQHLEKKTVYVWLDENESKSPETVAARIYWGAMSWDGTPSPPMEWGEFRWSEANRTLPMVMESEWKKICTASIAKHHVLFTHGIRTLGRWIEKTTYIFETEYGFSCQRWKYGYLRLFSFLTGNHIIDHLAFEFLTKITEAQALAQQKNAEFVVICHSYGTLLLGEALRKAKQLKIPLDISVVILNGSILPSSYDWTQFWGEAASVSGIRVQRVFNMRGQKDFWPVLAGSLRSRYGSAGCEGFNHSTEQIKDYALENMGHSEILNEDVVRGYWVGFIQNTPREDTNAWIPSGVSVTLASWLIPFFWVAVFVLIGCLAWKLYVVQN